MDGSTEDRRAARAANGVSAQEPGLPRLHVLVSEHQLGDPGALPTIEQILERAGPVGLHLRARVPARRLFDAVERLSRAAEGTGSWLVVNGRPDIALAGRASAVQLGGAALDVSDVRRLVAASGRALRIGASIHGPEEAVPAVRAGADYLVVGTIYSTPSHPGREGRGPVLVSRVLGTLPEALRRPVLAIGGIDAERAIEVVKAGGYGIVVSRAVWRSSDPVLAVQSLRQTLEMCVGEADREKMAPMDGTKEEGVGDLVV